MQEAPGHPRPRTRAWCAGAVAAAHHPLAVGVGHRPSAVGVGHHPLAVGAERHPWVVAVVQPARRQAVVVAAVVAQRRLVEAE